MKRIFYQISRFLMKMGFFGLLGALVYNSILKEYSVPSLDQLRAGDNVSDASVVRDGALVSRMSAVKVLSLSPEYDGMIASSGTYITLEGRYFILTAAHGLHPDCNLIQFLGAASNGEYVDCVKVIEINHFLDYAIVEVEEIPDLRPVNIVTQSPRNTDWTQTFAALSELVYTGYPNSIGVLTMRGYVMGYSEDDLVFVHSYGWAGASGSGVFNPNGQLAGYVTALLIGETEYGYDVLEDVVIVRPLFNINWSVIQHR